MFNTGMHESYLPKEFMVLDKEAEQNTSPLSWSPLWKNKILAQGTEHWLSAAKTKGKEGMKMTMDKKTS